MPESLSKSRYTAFCQCPKNLWLKVYKPEEAKEDDALKARFEQGNVVGDLAMGLFGDFKEVTVKNPDGSLDLKKMCSLTRQCIDEGVDNICEASFAMKILHKLGESDSHESHYCAVDILRRNGDGWDIYEVKSSSFPECDGEETKLEKYAPDIAYQKWVLTQCDVKVVNTYLVCLNSSYVRHGELDIKSLFVIVNMHDLIENEYLKVPAQSRQALKVLGMKDEPDIDLSEHCKKPYTCAFIDYCKRQHGVPQDQPTVFDLYRMNFSKMLEHYHAGRITFDALRGEKLNDKQQMQVECTSTPMASASSSTRSAIRFISLTSRRCRMPCRSMRVRNPISKSLSSIRCTSRRARMPNVSIRSSLLPATAKTRAVPWPNICAKTSR